MIRADSLWDAGSVSGDAINGGIARIGESRRSGFSTTDRKIAFGRLPDTPWSRHTYFLCTGFQSGRCPIELATSAVSRQCDTLLEIFGAYKIPANDAIAAEIICSGNSGELPRLLHGKAETTCQEWSSLPFASLSPGPSPVTSGLYRNSLKNHSLFIAACSYTRVGGRACEPMHKSGTNLNSEHPPASLGRTQ